MVILSFFLAISVSLSSNACDATADQLTTGWTADMRLRRSAGTVIVMCGDLRSAMFGVASNSSVTHTIYVQGRPRQWQSASFTDGKHHWVEAFLRRHYWNRKQTKFFRATIKCRTEAVSSVHKAPS